MSEIDLELSLYIFILAGFLGIRIISRVPPLLHTPLMSATNAISGISLIGSIVVAGAQHGWFHTFLGFIAVCCSATNVVGGFLITDRMLKMFKSEKEDARAGRGVLRVEILVPAAFGVLAVFLAILHGLGVLGDAPAQTVLSFLYIL